MTNELKNIHRYIEGDDGTVRKIKPDGTEVWAVDGPLDCVCAVAVDANGNVYSKGGSFDQSPCCSAPSTGRGVN